jgi:hypothetical protein
VVAANLLSCLPDVIEHPAQKEGDDTGVFEPGKTCIHINITELGSIYTFALDFIVDSPYFLRVC